MVKVKKYDPGTGETVGTVVTDEFSVPERSEGTVNYRGDDSSYSLPGPRVLSLLSPTHPYGKSTIQLIYNIKHCVYHQIAAIWIQQ